MSYGVRISLCVVVAVLVILGALHYLPSTMTTVSGPGERQTSKLRGIRTDSVEAIADSERTTSVPPSRIPSKPSRPPRTITPDTLFSAVDSSDAIGSKLLVFKVHHEWNSALGFKNRNPFPISVDLRIVAKNFDVEPSETVRKTLEGRESATLVTLQRKSRAASSWKSNTSWRIGKPGALHDSTHVYRLPFVGSLGGGIRISQGYDGEFSHSGKKELDFAIPQNGHIVCARKGYVIETEDKYTFGSATDVFLAKGNVIRVLHDDGSIATYAHLAPKGVRVSVGQEVEPGKVIGLCGNTGYSRGPHLHFAVGVVNDTLGTTTVSTLFATRRNVSGQVLVEGESYSLPKHIATAASSRLR